VKTDVALCNFLRQVHRKAIRKIPGDETSKTVGWRADFFN